MDLQLEGKTAIITGGSRGIGKAVARELAREGVDVAIVARGAEGLEATAQELASETGRRIVPLTADTGSDESVKAMVRKAHEALGHIDILVNCAAQPAGQAPPPKLPEIDDDVFYDDVKEVMGYLRTAREVAPIMKEQGWGRIINISGLAARGTGSIVGSIRNVAVVAMTKNLADELGPFGVNATVVHPGTTRTEKSPEVFAWQAGRDSITVEEVERRLANSNTVRRVIDAQDIAYVVTMLASPRSIAINGDVIAAGGGQPGRIYY